MQDMTAAKKKKLGGWEEYKKNITRYYIIHVDKFTDLLQYTYFS